MRDEERGIREVGWIEGVGRVGLTVILPYQPSPLQPSIPPSTRRYPRPLINRALFSTLERKESVSMAKVTDDHEFPMDFLSYGALVGRFLFFSLTGKFRPA